MVNILANLSWLQYNAAFLNVDGGAEGHSRGRGGDF